MRSYLLAALLMVATCHANCQSFFDFAQMAMASPDYLLGFKKLTTLNSLSDSLDSKLKEGIAYLQEGNFKESERAFNNIILKNDKILDAYYYRGIVRRFLNQINLAEKDFETVTSLDKNSYEGYIELGKTAMFASDLLEAQEHYQTCIKLNPTRPEAYLFLGDIDYRKSDLEGAEKNYQKSLEVDTTFNAGRVRLSIVAAARSKNSISALPELNRILRYDSGSREALLFRALVTRQTDPKAALADINRLILSTRVNPNLKFVRGMVLVEAKDFDAAFSDFRETLRQYPANYDQFSQRLDLQNACEYAISKIYGESEVDRNHIREAFCKLMLGRCSEAIEALKLVSGFERSALCQYLTGIANEHLKNHSEALASYSNAVLLDSNILDAHIKIGLYQLNVQKMVEAELEFSKSLELSPTLKSVRKFRAISRIRQANYKSAIQDLNKVLAIDSLDKEALILRYRAYILSSDTHEASADHAALRRMRDREYLRIAKVAAQMATNKDTTYAVNFLKSYSLAKRSIEASVIQIEILLKQKKFEEASQVATFVIDAEIRLIHVYCLEYDQSFLVTALAEYQAFLKNFELAQQYFDRALEIDKENAFSYLERGKYYLARKKKQPAKQDLKKAAELGNEEAKQILFQLK